MSNTTSENKNEQIALHLAMKYSRVVTCETCRQLIVLEDNENRCYLCNEVVSK